MRVQLTFRTTAADGTIRLPFRYPELVQAMIYRHLTPRHAQKLHDEGFLLGKRRFKLFTFSRVRGPRIRSRGETNGQLIFRDRIYLHIASPVEWLLPELANAILKVGEVQLGNNLLLVEEITVYQPIIIEPPIKLRMLSPVTIYSTLRKESGQKKTYYYNPREKEFSVLLSENARKKYEILYKTVREGGFEITPLRNPRLHPINYKGTIIHAWSGLFEAKGDAELLQVTYDCGLGAKNSQGFGMWELVE